MSKYDDLIAKKAESAQFMVDEITHICRDLPKRGPGSEGEKAASEYITPTFLPCILLGLSNAPLIGGDINIEQLDYLVMPFDSLGSVPVYEAIKRNIPVYAIKENTTVLDITNDNLHKSDNIKVVDTYSECLELIKNN